MTSEHDSSNKFLKSHSYLMNYIYLMSLNRVKLGRDVTFIKHLASVVSLIYLALTLIWNKIKFPA